MASTSQPDTIITIADGWTPEGVYNLDPAPNGPPITGPTALELTAVSAGSIGSGPAAVITAQATLSITAIAAHAAVAAPASGITAGNTATAQAAAGGGIAHAPHMAPTSGVAVTAIPARGALAAPRLAVTESTSSVSIANVPGTPSTLLVAGNQAWGTYYLPTPTIVMWGQDAVSNNGSGTSAIAIGGTSWQVIDGNANVVGSGTMLSSATTITVCSSGVWVGGLTAVPGHYTIVCSNGATGTVAVCIATSNLWQPPAAYNTGIVNGVAFSAWLGSANDRDQYAIQQVGYVVEPSGAAAATQIISNITNDPYYGAGGAPMPPGRSRHIWIAPSEQPNFPTQQPTSTFWGQFATAMVSGGYAGQVWYDLPCNEPENGSWTISEIITYWNACATAILAADPTSHVLGWCSAGIYNNSTIANVAQFLTDITSPISAFTNHMEASDQNLADFVALRQYYGGMKAQFATSGLPNLDYRNTETGIQGGQFGVLQPRREARQRTMVRFVAEQYGWSSQNQYDFEVFDHQGSGSGPHNGLPMYLVDKMSRTNNGNMRAGAYAIHVYNDALFNTSCSPTSIPAKLSFGTAGGMADSMFAGLHYTGFGSNQDVVVLATSGIVSATVTLTVSATGSITYWDGWGVPSTTTVSAGTITIPVNDLLTYVFLPHATTVSVLDTDQGAVTMSAATNLALTATSVVNESGTAVPTVHNGSWAENNSGVTGVSAPYKDAGSPPYTITVTQSSAHTIAGFAIKSPAPAWQPGPTMFGCSITAANVTIDGVQVWSFTDATAVSYSIPSPSNGNSDDPCTRTTWWQQPYGFVYRLPTPISGTVIKLTVTATGYGGQPDLAAADNTNSFSGSGFENHPQQLQLAEFAVFS